MAVESAGTVEETPVKPPMIRVDRMGLADLDEVMKIETVSFPTPWARPLYEHEILNRLDDSVPVVARYRDQEEILAHAVWWLVADECHLANLAVAVEHRGKGVGDALLRACLLDALRRRLQYVVLEVRQTNRVAQRLYEKYGFRTIAIRQKYYQDNDEDAFVMMLSPLPEVDASGLEIDL